MLPAFQTVSEAIARVGLTYPDHDFVFQDLNGVETSFTFVALEVETARRAAGLQALGLEKGDRIGLVVIEPQDFVLTFLAALRVGVVPVPMYPPVSFGNLDAYVARTRRVLDSAAARCVVMSSKVVDALADQMGVPLVRVETVRSDAAPVYPDIRPQDLAFLQYTSGSTSDPKGVMVTHASLIANSKGIILEGLQLVAENNDKGVSWLPLYHDMGLIGFVIAPIVHGISVVFIPTLRFVKRPSVWLDTIHRHRGNASFAPNFAFLLATKRVRESELASWDLSCLRVLGCGAEPINPGTVRAFADLFHERCKLPSTAIMPAYGMAEATLAISLKPAPEPFVTVDVDGKELVPCGVPFVGHEVAAFDDEGNRLPERVEGELWFRGPSVTAGYFRNPEATAVSFRADGWLRTGDLGVIVDGKVCCTGRVKDLIIANGRNVHPQAVEWAVANVEGVKHGNVVAFSVPGPAGEQLIVAAETRDDGERFVRDVRSAVLEEVGLPIAEVVCLRSGALPKTSSGKLQRRKTRELYLSGALVAPQAAGDAEFPTL